MDKSSIPEESLQEVRNIRRLMERSSRFSTLSGLSLVFAGLTALAGAYGAWTILSDYYGSDLSAWVYDDASYAALRQKLIFLAALVFAVAFLLAFYFTWQKSKRQSVSLLAPGSRKVFWAMTVPLVAGAIYVWHLMGYSDWKLVAPSCLIFYGLALVNSGKYTVSDIRILGYCQIVLGLINLFVSQNGFAMGLYFWAFGFGVLHIIYGWIIWHKYDRKAE